ncbi:hypothetical protein LY76DRAFT_281138 [Colletotrichum caudatum]|nr:hypothetical protein LY76DRAFT_281138 [Colletotrichum caudatum]
MRSGLFSLFLVFILGTTAVSLPCLALFRHVCHSLWSHFVEATRSRTPNLGMFISFLSRVCEAAYLRSLTNRAALRLAGALRRRGRGLVMKNEVIHEKQDEATTPEESFSIGPFTNSHHCALGMIFLDEMRENETMCPLTGWDLPFLHARLRASPSASQLSTNHTFAWS